MKFSAAISNDDRGTMSSVARQVSVVTLTYSVWRVNLHDDQRNMLSLIEEMGTVQVCSHVLVWYNCNALQCLITTERSYMYIYLLFARVTFNKTFGFSAAKLGLTTPKVKVSTSDVIIGRWYEFTYISINRHYTRSISYNIYLYKEL